MIVFPSAARAAATYTQEVRVPADCEGVLIMTDSTSATVGTVDTQVEVYDDAKAAWVAMRDGEATPAAITTGAIGDPARSELLLHPATTLQKTGAERRYPVGVPTKLRIAAVVAGATVTFSVSLKPLR